MWVASDWCWDTADDNGAARTVETFGIRIGIYGQLRLSA